MNYPQTPASYSVLMNVDPSDNPAGLDHGRSSSGGSTEYPTGPGPTNSTAPPRDVVFTSATSTTGMTVARGAGQKPRHERKGHTKSRRGCYHCKARRIKCQETRPECGHCVKAGLRCQYPATPSVTHQPKHQVPLFSLQDMRFFQHFLLSCVPHQPLGNERIWRHEVPCLSQNHEYLMHALLGLSASDLVAKGDLSLLASAMAHRLKAIQYIKKALNSIAETDPYEAGNAMMATCFALTFQSVLLDDGMAEFMTFCRGIVIVAIQMYHKQAKFIFHNFLGEEQLAQLKPRLEIVPLIPTGWTDIAVQAIRGLRPLCVHAVEIGYWKLLLNIAEALYTSPVLAYQLLSEHYGWWMQIPHGQFQRIVDPSNTTCVLLGSHWIATKQIMATISNQEKIASPQRARSETGSVDGGMVRWLRYLNRHVPPEYQQYNNWPTWVEARLEEDITFFGKSLD